MVQRNQNIFRFFSADDKVIQCHWGQVNSVGSRLVIIDGVALSHEKLGKEPNLTTPCNFKIKWKIFLLDLGIWIMIWRCPFSSISSRIFQKNLWENYMLWKPNWPHLRCFLWKVFWPFTKKRTIHVPRGCWKSFSKAGFEAICSNQCQINPSVLNSLKTQNYKERIPAN